MVYKYLLTCLSNKKDNQTKQIFYTDIIQHTFFLLLCPNLLQFLIAHSGAVPYARMANLWAGFHQSRCVTSSPKCDGQETEAVSLLPTGDKEVLDIGQDSLKFNSLHISEIVKSNIQYISWHLLRCSKHVSTHVAFQKQVDWWNALAWRVWTGPLLSNLDSLGDPVIEPRIEAIHHLRMSSQTIATFDVGGPDGKHNATIRWVDSLGFVMMFILYIYIIKGSLVANFRYTNFWVAGQE